MAQRSRGGKRPPRPPVPPSRDRRYAAARWVRVARVDDVPPGAVRRIRAAGRKLVLVNRAGKFFALDAVCPHAGGPLDEGELYHGALECPWHRFRYDPRTGRNLYPANVYPDDMPQLMEEIKPVETFRVKVRGDEVFVGLPGNFIS